MRAPVSAGGWYVSWKRVWRARSFISTASLLAARRATIHGYRRTTLLLDNAFAKVTKPAFLRIALDVASSLNVSLIVLSGIKDPGALTVFPHLVQLRVARRDANFVVPADLDDDRLQALLRDGALYASPTEWEAAASDSDESAWPVTTSATVALNPQDALGADPAADLKSASPVGARGVL